MYPDKMICITCNSKKATHGIRAENAPKWCANCAKDISDQPVRNLNTADCQAVDCEKYAKYYIDESGLLIETKAKKIAVFCKKHGMESFNKLVKQMSEEMVDEEILPEAPEISQDTKNKKSSKNDKSKTKKQIADTTQKVVKESVSDLPINNSKSQRSIDPQESTDTTQEVLKKWNVGTLIGKGACGSVYETTPVKPIKKLENIPLVIKIIPLSKEKDKKRIVDTLHYESILYNTVLQGSSAVPRVPLGGYGEANGKRFLVMEQLGKSLEDSLRENGPISNKEAANIGLQLIDFFEFFHSKGKLYVDVKPDNFLFGLSNPDKIYCTDFGLVESYIVMNKHKTKSQCGIAGTPTFLSLDCHQGFTHARKDDIEALLYVLIYIMKGKLPWQNAKNDNQGADKKKNTSIDKLCNRLNEQWKIMLYGIRECEFSAKPDYEWFRDCLKSIN